MSYCQSNTPDPLQLMCVRYCANNVETLTQLRTDDTTTPERQHQENYYFPVNISQMLVDYIVTYLRTEQTADYVKLITLFSDANKTPLRRLDLRQDHDLKTSLPMSIFNQPLHHLELSCCQFCYFKDKPESATLKLCNQIYSSLKTLKLVFCDNCLIQDVMRGTFITDSLEELGISQKYCFDKHKEEEKKRKVGRHEDLSVIFPAITHFTITMNNMSFSPFTSRGNAARLVDRCFCTSFTRLTHLNILGVYLTENDLGFLDHLPNLVSLVLSGLEFIDLPTGLRRVSKARNLRHLDMSCFRQDPKLYCHPEESMWEMLENLPYLTSLDISGTNLAGGVSTHAAPGTQDSSSQPSDSDTKRGSFRKRKFTFLGLWNCPDLPFTWDDVPAKQFTSSHSIENMMLAVEVYKQNTEMMLVVLPILTNEIRDNPERNTQAFLNRCTPALMENLMRVLHLNLHVNLIQSCCSCIVMLLMRETASHREIADGLGQSLRARILETTICCMNNTKNSSVIANCLGIFQYLNIPHDAKYCYSMKRFLLCLMNMLWRKDSPVHSSPYFERSVIKLIKFTVFYADHNTRDFIGAEGFVEANLSEGQELKKTLLRNEELMTRITNLTESSALKNAVSYQATCVMANLVSDGPEAWTLKSLDRRLVLSRISSAVQRWDITASTKTLYRSLVPFLEMAQRHHTPEAQLLAVWCICNLIKTKGKVYCQMLKMEGGVKILDAIAHDPRTTADILELICHGDRVVMPKVYSGQRP